MAALELLDRGQAHLRAPSPTHLPPDYPRAIEVLLAASLGPEHATDELLGVGMAPFFYLPHTLFVAEHGLDHFDVSMRAQYELTKRFSAEGSIRPYIRDPALRERAVEKVSAAARSAGLEVLGTRPSQVPGAEGNQEIFLHARGPASPVSGAGRKSLG